MGESNENYKNILAFRWKIALQANKFEQEGKKVIAIND